jgi:hypothetical protein
VAQSHYLFYVWLIVAAQQQFEVLSLMLVPKSHRLLRPALDIEVSTLIVLVNVAFWFRRRWHGERLM